MLRPRCQPCRSPTTGLSPGLTRTTLNHRRAERPRHSISCKPGERLKVPFVSSLLRGELKPTRTLRVLLALAASVAPIACRSSRPTRPVSTQVVVLGFDGADPNLLSKWAGQGKLPNLAMLAKTGTFRPLGTTNPPESPVAWASFATGLNPRSEEHTSELQSPCNLVCRLL